MTNIPKHAKCVFKWIIFDTYQREQELYDGTTTTFEALKRRWTAMVLPILDNWNYVLCIQEQPGYSRRLDLLWWRQDDWEALLETARRELLEESGYEAEIFELVIDKNPRAPKVDWPIHYFIANGLRKVADPNLDAGEKLELFEISPADFEAKRYPDWVDIWGDVEEIWLHLFDK